MSKMPDVPHEGRLRVGVAMATHNGVLFLSSQLKSLARQTRLPDEMVVYDDCSTDDTRKLVAEFARTAPFPVTLVRGTAQRGYAAAFYAAARRCRSELVAFCDQDDIWEPKKLENCVAEFERRADVTLVVHSARVMGARSRHRWRRYPAFVRRRVVTPAAAPLLAEVPGFAIVASRRVVDPWSILDELPESTFGWDHDDATAAIASAVGLVVLLPDSLVRYRQHDANVWGAPASRLADRVALSLASRGEEPQMYRDIAAWAADHVRLMEWLGRRVESSPRNLTREGPAARAALWARLAFVNDRRSKLYALRVPGRSGTGVLIRGALRGDYGARARGGLGLSSLGRDLLHVLGVLRALA